MEENMNVFDFKLTEDDLRQIRLLDTGHSLFFSHYDPSTVEMLISYAK